MSESKYIFKPARGAIHAYLVHPDKSVTIFKDIQDGAGDKIAAAMNERQEVLDALENLRKELHAHIKLDVKKHYSLMVADAAAGKILVKAGRKL